MDELAGIRPPEQHLTAVGDFIVDREAIRIWRGNKPLELSLRQFQMLEYFLRHAGEAVSLNELRDAIWGRDSDIKEGSLTVEIVRLRRAIGGRRNEQPIRTLRKRGYVFKVPKQRGSTKHKPQPEPTP